MGKSVLLSKIRTEIRRQGMGYQTEQMYVGWITRYIYYHNFEHPKRMREEEVVEFLNYLVIRREVPDSVKTQAQQAIQFLYRYIIGQPLASLKGVKKGKTPYIYHSRNIGRKKRISAS